MAKTSTTASAPSAPADINAGAPLADAGSFFTKSEFDAPPDGLREARKGFDSVLDRAGFKRNGTELHADDDGESDGEGERDAPAEEPEQPEADEDDPRVARAKKFLKRHGYDEDLLATKDAEWVLARKAKLIEQQSQRDSQFSALRQEIAELRRTRAQPDDNRTAADARQTPSRAAVDFSSELTHVREQFGDDAAKAFEAMAKKIETRATGAVSDVAARLEAIEAKNARRESAETQRSVVEAIDSIVDQFPDLDDDPSLRTELEERMNLLAPGFADSAKRKGPKAALRELAVAAAGSLGLDEEDVETAGDEEERKPTGRARKPQLPVTNSRRPSPKPPTGTQALRKVFDYVLDNRARDPNVIDSALKSVGRTRSRTLNT